MQCIQHPDRKAEYICFNCGAPICSDCSEEIRPGAYHCFRCAMLQSISEVDSKLKEKQQNGTEKTEKQKKKWGSYHTFLTASSVLIIMICGFILFGGQSPPKRTAEFTKNDRVFLFMVDGAVKRYAHYEGNEYPERLSDLVSPYLALKDAELFHLEKFSYERDPTAGYKLCLVKQDNSEMKLLLSAKGIAHLPLASEGIR